MRMLAAINTDLDSVPLDVEEEFSQSLDAYVSSLRAGILRHIRSIDPTARKQVTAGGPGSGCHGDNCGRPPGSGGMESVKVSGNVAEGKELLSKISALDKTGQLSAFLSANPIAELHVSDKPLRHPVLSRADAVYQVSTGKVYVREQAKLVRSDAFDQESTVGNSLAGNDDAKNQLFGVVHELGHHVWETLDKGSKDNAFRMETIKAYQQDKNPPSKYAKTNFREYFSEALTAHLGGGKLSPVATQLVTSVLKKAAGFKK